MAKTVRKFLVGDLWRIGAHENDIDRLNEYSSKWSPFAPLQYESYETGLVSDETWKDGSGVYSPSIHTQVYKVVFPSKGKVAIYVRYFGYADMDVLVENVKEKIDLIGKLQYFTSLWRSGYNGG